MYTVNEMPRKSLIINIIAQFLRCIVLFFRIKKHKRKRRGVDYNAEIPFEKKPAPGL